MGIVWLDMKYLSHYTQCTFYGMLCLCGDNLFLSTRSAYDPFINPTTRNSFRNLFGPPDNKLRIVRTFIFAETFCSVSVMRGSHIRRSIWGGKKRAISFKLVNLATFAQKLNIARCGSVVQTHTISGGAAGTSPGSNPRRAHQFLS